MKRITIIMMFIATIFIISYISYSTVGGAKIYFKLTTNEVIIDRFPNYSIGFDGKYHWDNPDFPFSKVDKYIYKIAKKSSADSIIIKIINWHTNEYGKEHQEPPKVIGEIDILESKKYKNFLYWNRKYCVKEMCIDYHKKLNEKIVQPQDSCEVNLHKSAI